MKLNNDKQKFSISKPAFFWGCFLIVSASFMRQLLNLSKIFLNRGDIELLIWATFAISILLAIKWIKPNLKKSLYLAAICLAGILYALTFDVAEERIHLVKYGILGFLIVYNLKNQSIKFKLLKALLYGLLIASIDEGFQYFLPYRVGDLRDVCFGGIGALWGAGLGIKNPIANKLG